MTKSKEKLSQAKKKEAIAGLLFASPLIIGLLVFVAFPFIMSLYYSFTSYNMKSEPIFKGLTNYIILFTNDSSFWPAFGNTIYHIIVATPISLVFGVALALILSSKIRGINIYRTIFYLPNVVSLVAMALLWLWLFQPSFGLINQMLAPLYRLFNMNPIGWLSDAKTAKLSIALMGLWNIGGPMVIYLAQIQDIPRELYEAADIDGAGSFRRLFRITLPLMTPAIFYNLIMSLITGFQVFLQSYIMTKGGPSRSTYYYAFYIYDKAFSDMQMGMACAMSWFLLIITLVITLLVFSFSGKWVFYLGGDDNKK